VYSSYGEKPPPVHERSPRYLAVSIVISIVVIAFFVWQPWNSNGVWWGK
jgi:hypothetical protein